MKKVIGVLLAVSALNANAEVLPAMEVFTSGLAQHEKAIVSNTVARCAGMMTVQSAVIARDAPNSEALPALDKSFKELSMVALVTNATIQESRGKQPELDSLAEEFSAQVDLMTNFYIDRMQENQISTGEMFGQDMMIQFDMEFCSLLPSMLNSQWWADVLENDDWTYWDENWVQDNRQEPSHETGV